MVVIRPYTNTGKVASIIGSFAWRTPLFLMLVMLWSNVGSRCGVTAFTIPVRSACRTGSYRTTRPSWASIWRSATTTPSASAESSGVQKDKRNNDRPPLSNDVPLYQAEGIFAVNKPLEWTSNDVVSYIRGILERDTRNRGGKVSRVSSRKNKSRIVRVGHGGTLDPLATGVLVVGVGKGTKELQG